MPWKIFRFRRDEFRRGRWSIVHDEWVSELCANLLVLQWLSGVTCMLSLNLFVGLLFVYVEPEFVRWIIVCVCWAWICSLDYCLCMLSLNFFVGLLFVYVEPEFVRWIIVCVCWAWICLLDYCLCMLSLNVFVGLLFVYVEPEFVRWIIVCVCWAWICLLDYCLCMLSLNLFVGLLFVYRILSSKISLKMTNWRKRRRWGGGI